jgi:transcriptional regulator with XRE-family HTH domain
MTQALNWKLRRVAAGIRQQDIALRAGMSTTRYSAIERGERVPSELEVKLINQFLPDLPLCGPDPSSGGGR